MKTLKIRLLEHKYEHNIMSFVLYNIHIDNKYEKDLICLIIKYKNI